MASPLTVESCKTQPFKIISGRGRSRSASSRSRSTTGASSPGFVVEKISWSVPNDAIASGFGALGALAAGAPPEAGAAPPDAGVEPAAAGVGAHALLLLMANPATTQGVV